MSDKAKEILIFERNLIWSARLANTLTQLGHNPRVLERVPEEIPMADIALVNLSETSFGLAELIPRLKDMGIRVIGHAGHKEKPLLEMGNEYGCDQVVSNSTITFKIQTLLA